MRTRTYPRALYSTLLIVAALGAACSKKSARVTPPSAPVPAPMSARPTVTLEASSTFVQQGESATLTWKSTNATSLSLAPGVGNVAAEGTSRVTPQDSTTYTITATGPGGEAESTVHISVTAAAATTPAPTSDSSSLQELFNREVKDAYFDYDHADIRPDARDNLSQTAQFLRAHPQIKVVIEGHCDERGSTEYNIALGDRRAAAAKQFLVSLGIAADRMESTSLGKERLFCTAATEQCYQQNRRAHFVPASR